MATRLADVGIEEDTWATVQLRHHDTFGTVDDERTVGRHQRNLAEVDRLLLDVGHSTNVSLGVDIPDDKTNDDFDRCRERHASFATLVNVVLRWLKFVGHELKRGTAGEVVNREDTLEHGLKALVLTLFHGP